jgi:hypothetical protein
VTTGPCTGLTSYNILVDPPESVLANGGSWPDDIRPDIWSYTLDTATCTITQHNTNDQGATCPAPLSAHVSGVFSTRGGQCHAVAQCAGACRDTGCTVTHVHR